MRKHQIQHVLDIVKTLREANKELCKQTSYESNIVLLADCQDCALILADYIDKLADAGTKTSGLLMKYAKMLFEASQTETESIHDIAKCLNKKLDQIEACLKSELKPDKIEVAFFPYQASMWDSLESVYLAAKADPSCDAYCVPVPWFEKLQNGRFGRMHYDGGQYPANIEITDWRKYDLESRRPDIIFVHCPYDDDNYVTSIHPDYYCEKLREYTDCLVYIPYFVVDGIVPEHFVPVAGCVYSHKVILQNEEVRDAYIRIFKKNFGNRFGNPHEKFVAWGSPKYDKAVNTRREDYELPELWDKIITNADGTKKKVVFYNTSIAAMLQYNEQYLIKLRSVFEVFKNRDDIALWWRPHPLLWQTIRSMRPALSAEWHDIVDEYKREGYGVFDETPDLHRAIAWSDVYYGDGGSVALLFAVTGKKIMLQDVTAYGFGTEVGFCPVMFCNNGSLYLAQYFDNFVYKLSLPFSEDAKAEYVGHIPNKPIFKERQHVAAITGEDKVYFIPCNDRSIIAYDFKSGGYEQYDIELDHRKFELWGYENNFRNGVLYKNKLFMLPSYYDAIVCYDFETKETSHCLRLTEILTEIDYKDDIIFVNYTFASESSLLIPFLRSNHILEFDLETHEHRLHKVGDGNGFVAINKYNNEYWLLERQRPRVYCWNYENGEMRVLSRFPNGFTKFTRKSIFGTLAVCLINNHLYCFAGYANMSVRIDLSSGSIERLSSLDKYCEEKNTATKLAFHSAVANGNVVYLHQTATNKIIEYNTETEDVLEYEFSGNDCFSGEASTRISNCVIDDIKNNPQEAYDPDSVELCGSAIFNYVKERRRDNVNNQARGK